MKNFYFTFGTNHMQKDGTEMYNRWVRVKAFDYNTARKLFVEKFSSVYMFRDLAWAFQYTEEEFDASFFELGEFMLIEQQAKICPRCNGNLMVSNLPCGLCSQTGIVDLCPVLKQEHHYTIVKGSGEKTGTPKWNCVACEHTLTSS